MTHVDHLRIRKTNHYHIVMLQVVDQHQKIVSNIFNAELPPRGVPLNIRESYLTTERCGMFGNRERYSYRDFIKIWENHEGVWP